METAPLLALLALLAVGECGSSRVVGRAGGNVTLDCNYDTSRHKDRSICWNRGELPISGCNEQLVATGHYRAHEEAGGSSRYQLLGRLDKGDVSLTILNLTEEDGGRYGCRVDIRGWFNDEKHHFDLTVDRVPQTTTSADANTQQTAARRTPDQMTPTENLSTSPRSSPDEAEQSGSSTLTLALLCVFFWLVALMAAGGIVLVVRRWWQVNKTPQVSSVVQFNSTASTLHLQSRASALENIYQIDESEYEQCP